MCIEIVILPVIESCQVVKGAAKDRMKVRTRVEMARSVEVEVEVGWSTEKRALVVSVKLSVRGSLVLSSVRWCSVVLGSVRW